MKVHIGLIVRTEKEPRQQRQTKSFWEKSKHLTLDWFSLCTYFTLFIFKALKVKVTLHRWAGWATGSFFVQSVFEWILFAFWKMDSVLTLLDIFQPPFRKNWENNFGTQEFLVFPTQGNQYHWDKKYVVACFHHISIISKALLLEFFLFIDGGEEEKVCKERRVGDGGGGQVTDCSLLHLSTKIQEEDVKDGLC